MKIVVLGKGFLGQAFAKEGYEVLGREDVSIESRETDLLWKKRLEGYNVIINCMGKSDTRWCELNFDEAFWSNAIVPKILSGYCAGNGIKFVHISTGCLYDDMMMSQMETDFLAKHCCYTVTKFVGEKGCRVDRDLIIRPRLFFGDFPHKNNLICKLKRFNSFVGEWNSFTSVHVIVKAVWELLLSRASGVYNVCCDGEATVADLADWMGLYGTRMTGKELRERESLFLVNNTMCIEKLKSIYQPPALREEFMRCVRDLG